MKQQTPNSMEKLQRLKLCRELQHNEQKIEVYLGLLRSGFGKLTETKLENISHLYQRVQKLKQRNRTLAKGLIELQNRRRSAEFREFFN